uniref:Mantle protein N24 n=1 Tax=Pinctada fucata TaxID=50426 RepID=A0A0E3XAN0_PINFU|nr:mantle protein N24 [Pinctada fucata]
MSRLTLLALLVAVVVISRVLGQGQEKEKRNEHEPGNQDGRNQNERRERNLKIPTRKSRRIVNRKNNGKQMLIWQRQNYVRNYRRISPTNTINRNNGSKGKSQNGGSGGNGSGNNVQEWKKTTLPIAKRFRNRNSSNAPRNGGNMKQQQYSRRNRRWNGMNRRTRPTRRYYPRVYGRYYQYGPYIWYRYGNKWKFVGYNRMYGRYRRPIKINKASQNNQGD